ncbi:MAG: type IV pilus modification protein PilV [Burkholderiales bacterium]|nr:type IV pilus modification protein PilV [Burkholderiales bacterium]
MLEVLIAIIVLSFGLLGMVGMQAAALQSNKEARFQSSGVRMARELGELMRGNKNIATNTATSSNPYLIDFPSTAIPTATNCLTGDCYSESVPATAQNVIANFEVREWLTRVNTELPGARVRVCFDDAPFDSSGIPKWDCTGGGTVAVIKIGWTRGSTDRSKSGAASLEKATGSSAFPPSVVVPVTAGSVT